MKKLLLSLVIIVVVVVGVYAVRASAEDEGWITGKVREGEYKLSAVQLQQIANGTVSIEELTVVKNMTLTQEDYYPNATLRNVEIGYTVFVGNNSLTKHADLTGATIAPAIASYPQGLGDVINAESEATLTELNALIAAAIVPSHQYNASELTALEVLMGW